MQFKASTDYGMRAILYLAAQGTTCSSKDIAQDMSIPRDYLIQLAQLLRNAGLIEARPGKHGGYRLAKEPSDITVLQIMSALEEDAKASTRAKRSSRKGGAMVQGVKQTYQLIEESFDAYLDSLTIEMMLESVKNGDNRRTFLAERLEDEGKRLAQTA
ncbi:Rrf2 family transcriptional regulator [Gordonibacter sp. 28C]|uniref:RrF2 family transcriptional regulator n=1 Tax=Gordonibacter sp. 28C TaxID=2078569 RepID=UPI000DF77ED9|nr:Rrf2 family transcriptional regulator [Gordonibacter sp. 28C]RDB59704.1 Rrf2 family transcriptional regulator [Gordonibacter sp. 28C]